MARRAVVIGLVALSVVLARLPGHSAHASASVPLSPLGQPRAGDLDSTFGNAGKVITDFDFSDFDSIEDLAVQRDGKIVAVGGTYDAAAASYRFAVARYTRNGSLDPAFGAGGKLTTDFGNAASRRGRAAEGRQDRCGGIRERRRDRGRHRPGPL